MTREYLTGKSLRTPAVEWNCWHPARGRNSTGWSSERKKYSSIHKTKPMENSSSWHGMLRFNSLPKN